MMGLLFFLSVNLGMLGESLLMQSAASAKFSCALPGAYRIEFGKSGGTPAGKEYADPAFRAVALASPYAHLAPNI